ncbi:MAG: hypothetical protein H7839_04910 [Magnetococcus sp. YQC-5]
MTGNIVILCTGTDANGNVPEVTDPDTEKERIYDEEIAPLLMKAGKIAQDNGMHFVAFVQYDGPWHTAHTECVNLDTAGPWMRLATYGARSKGNMDELIISLIRDDKKHSPDGRTASMFMRQINRGLHQD